MRDYEEKSFYEIQLDNKQLILVFLAGVTVCVLVFILGVMVGQGRKEAELAAASRNNESQAVRPEPDMEPPQEIQAVTPSKKQDEKKQKEAAPKSENVSEYLDLEKDTENSLVKEPSKTKKEETKVSAKEEPKVAAKEEPKVETKVPEKKPEPEVTKPVVVEPEPAQEPQPALKESGRYTVQVMATSSKPKAEAQLAALQSKGYTAFMNEESAAGNPVFKVRVGKFSDADTARKTAVRLKQELQLETWVAVLD